MNSGKWAFRRLLWWRASLKNPSQILSKVFFCEGRNPHKKISRASHYLISRCRAWKIILILWKIFVMKSKAQISLTIIYWRFWRSTSQEIIVKSICEPKIITNTGAILVKFFFVIHNKQKFYCEIACSSSQNLTNIGKSSQKSVWEI